MRISSKLPLITLRAGITGAVRGICNFFGPEALGEMIRNDWHVISALHYAASGAEIGKDRKLSDEQIQEIQRRADSILNMVLPILDQARALAMKFPPEEIEARASPEWIMAKGEEKFPILVKVVKEHKAQGRRWLRVQCREISDYLLGRSIYSTMHERMITGKDRKEVEEYTKWIQTKIRDEKLEGQALAGAQSQIGHLNRLREQASQSP